MPRFDTADPEASRRAHVTVTSSVRAMQIEQALYGDDRGGHSLLASSGDDEISTRIVPRLDLPDTAPPGIEWSPFLRGFPFANRYVLSRTFHDASAPRGGMVFSHALLAPLDEIVEVSDLGPLLSLLAISDRQRPDATTVEVERAETRVRKVTDLVETAEALVANGRLPVVRISHVGFDDLVIALWTYLLPEIRRGFAFRLSFDPRDLVETPMPALVCTPQAMAARWSGYPVIRSVARREARSLAAAILSGDGKAAALREFMQQMGVKPQTFSELRLVEQAYRLDIGGKTLERCVGAVRLIEKLSPDSEVGKEGKDIRVRRLCDLVRTARVEDILLLRNVRLAAFPLPSRIWNALETWFAENSYPQNQDVEMLSLLEDATSSDAAVREWRTAVLDGLAAATRLPRTSFPRAFWRWLNIRPEIVAAVFSHVPAEAAVEERLACRAPRDLDKAAAETLATDALSRGWLRLHGAVLSASCSISDAVRRQVSVDTDPSFMEGLRSVLRNCKPGELVDCALEIKDPRMPRLAGEAVAKHPRLLAEVDLTAIRAQAIWREALTIDPESWRGPVEPAAAFHSILDSLLDGREADILLIERLLNTPVADLGTYERRSDIWSRIVGVALQNLLTTTASGWLRQSASVGVPFVPDYDLQTAILKDGEFEQTLNALIPNNVGNAVRIIASLNQYEEQWFQRLIKRVISRTAVLETADAKAIGRLVLKHQWKDTTTFLVMQYRSGRSDFRPALRECYDLMGFWDRITLPLTPISEREKWEGFLELAVELYPGGPDDLGLWERAGGDDADLSTKENGRTRWRKVVRDIRNGRGPTPSALLAEMKKDFPNNERISHLAGDRVFGGCVTDGLRDE